MMAYRLHFGKSKDYVDISSVSVVKSVVDRLARSNRLELIPGKAGGIKVVGGRWSLASEERPAYQIDKIEE